MKDFKFSIPLKVRIGDINYGNHVGHHVYFLYFQDARIAYLNQFGCSELDIFGYGMIMASADCRYKRELKLGDEIEITCRVSELKSKLFIMAYQIERSNVICATGTTTNVCFDYGKRQITDLPRKFIDAIKKYEGI